MSCSLKKILVVSNQNDWKTFLTDFFEDTLTEMLWAEDANKSSAFFGKFQPDLVFVDSAVLPMSFEQKIKVLKQTNPAFKIFYLGKQLPSKFWDGFFEPGISMLDFQKALLEKMPLPELIQVLVADDEEEIGTMICDFLSARSHPSFQVRYVNNGKKALEEIEKKSPDILVLDIKMPVMDGREVFMTLAQRKSKIPVILFFDAITGDELSQVRQYGSPSVIEKGARQSALPEMMHLIKKKVFFG